MREQIQQLSRRRRRGERVNGGKLDIQRLDDGDLERMALRELETWYTQPRKVAVDMRSKDEEYKVEETPMTPRIMTSVMWVKYFTIDHKVPQEAEVHMSLTVSPVAPGPLSDGPLGSVISDQLRRPEE